jgi:hypothetical protein
MREGAFQFVVYGVLLTAASFVIQRTLRSAKQRKYRNVVLWGLGLIGIAGISGVFAFINAPPGTLGKGVSFQELPIAEGLLFVTMLFGMVASYLTKQIEQRRNRIEEKRKRADTSSTPLEFDIWEFTYPMLVSVITFGIILQSIGEKAVDLPSVILSFQTGFFWQTVLARSVPK